LLPWLLGVDVVGAWDGFLGCRHLALLGLAAIPRGGDVEELCEILAQRLNRIDRILIPPRYTFFSRSPTVKNSGG
jgi:hypothetical protein